MGYDSAMRLLSKNAAVVLDLLLEDITVPRYGYELMRDTGIKSGSLYPILGRFEGYGWIEGAMEHTENGRPPRRVYRVRPDGIGTAQAALDRYIEVKGQGAHRLAWGS